MVDLENFPAENFLANVRTEGESLRCVKISLRNIFRNNPLRPPLHGGHLSQRERQGGFSGTARLSSLKKELPPGCKFSAIGRRFLCYCGAIRVYPKGFTSKLLLAVVNRRAVDAENFPAENFLQIITNYAFFRA